MNFIVVGIILTNISRFHWPICRHRYSQSRFCDTHNCCPYNCCPYNGSPYNGCPYNGCPYNGSPYNGSPYNGSPYNGSPYNGSPYNCCPYNGSTYNLSASPYFLYFTATITNSSTRNHIRPPAPIVSSSLIFLRLWSLWMLCWLLFLSHKQFLRQLSSWDRFLHLPGQLVL